MSHPNPRRAAVQASRAANVLSGSVDTTAATESEPSPLGHVHLSQTMLDEMVEESSIASSVSTADDDMLRFASDLGFNIEQSFEASALYRREMGDLIFRVESRKNAESPNNGIFRGAVVRVIGQNVDKLPPSVARRVERGTLLMVPLGSFDDAGVLKSPVLADLDDAPVGSVWALQPPKYLPATGDSPGGFARTPTSGDRSFYPYRLHRLGLKAKG